MRPLVLVVLVACGGAAVDPISQLEDPSTCKSCHPQHFAQWSESMHAYASVDPVFIAMNKRGQRETDNQLGTFCVQCHAPMAVALKLTDGTDYDPTMLTAATNGVTCYFCHNVDKVVDTHNNGLQIALDQTMRGGLANPTATPAHHSKDDPLMVSESNDSSMCGSCHDIVNGHGVAIERTFKEWQTTFFTESDPLHHLTCGGCHMRSSTGQVADPSTGAPVRQFGIHEHLWQGIDQAVTDGFPGGSDLATEIQGDLDPAIGVVGATPISGPPSPGGICVDQGNGGEITVRVDSIGVGHAWPSGSSQDRRAWLELTAFDGSGSAVFSTGVVPDGMDPEQIADPNLLAWYDRALGSDGQPAHMFWDIASETSPCASQLPCLLKPPTTLNPNDPAFDHSSTKIFVVGALAGSIQTIQAQIHIRPYSFATLSDLVQSGDLDSAVVARVPTLDIAGTQRVWDRATAGTGAAINTGCSPQ
jgi:hypothetical protein|nr:multiheme c-type cytochrome [Kofleriaceae bacterium]